MYINIYNINSYSNNIQLFLCDLINAMIQRIELALYKFSYDRAYVYNYLITVRLQNAEGVPPENSQRHSLEQEITLALILKSHSKSADQILKKLDRRFLLGAGRLDSNWLEDEASAQFGVLGDFPDFLGVRDGSSGERRSY